MSENIKIQQELIISPEKKKARSIFAWMSTRFKK